LKSISSHEARDFLHLYPALFVPALLQAVELIFLYQLSSCNESPLAPFLVFFGNMSAQRNYLNFKIITTLILATDGFLLADPDFSVEIITLSINASLQQSLIPLIDPAIDLAVQEIQSQYGQVFKLTHTYLLDQSIRTCTDLEAVSDNLLAQYYYQKRAATNMTAIITPGTRGGSLKKINQRLINCKM
jgi:hypothetical protein